MAVNHPKRVWLITYGSCSPSLTWEMCAECGISIDECYTLTQREFKYTLIHSPQKKGFTAVQKMLAKAENAYGIVPSNIFGYDPVAGNNTSLQDHPGMRLLIDSMNHKDNSFEHWLLSGDIYSCSRGVMHRYLMKEDRSKMTRSQLDFQLGKKDSRIKELEESLLECEHLNEQLGAQNDDFRAKYKKARVEITNLRNENAILKTRLSVYEEDSGAQSRCCCFLR